VVLFQPMMATAQGPEIAPARPAATIVRLGVVEIAAPGGLAAAPEPAGEVARGHKFHEPGRWPVGRRGPGVSTATRNGIGGARRRGPRGRAAASTQGSRQDRTQDRVLHGVTANLTGR
jgi:hypothetical protein